METKSANTTNTTKSSPTQNKIRYPTQSYDREEFYKSLENVRYILKVNLTNGQQAEDIPIGIETLIEFLGDVEHIINTHTNISVNFRNHTHWTAKLNTGDNTHLNKIDWKQLEQDIETLAENYGIALRKSTSMSGRGHSSTGMRLVSVTYSFGTKKDDSDLINCENNPLSKVNWVGGELGNKQTLNESTITIKHIESHTPTFRTKVKEWFTGIIR